MLDASARVAGTGSLGRFRYAVLLPGKGGKAGKELVLELKEALASSLAPDSPVDQAARVVATQQKLQGDSPAYLGTATIGALINAGGYGEPILTGIRRTEIGLILQGAVPAAILALLVQAGFEALEPLLVPRGLRIAAAGKS